MAGRGKIDEPGVMEAILEGIRNRPREYWVEKLARYDNEKPGDIILPGVPLDRIKRPSTTDTPKKPARKDKKAA